MKIEVKGQHPQEWYEKRLQKTAEYALGVSAQMEQWAKANAPWKDQTGDARNSLQGGVELHEKSLNIWVGQGKAYGVYLEKDHDKKYAICEPTIKHYAPLINDTIKKAWNEST
ncbi:MAG: hypothetical protein LBP76_09440 [Treponema sp.]|jgi:hypothetical protein|nr:hypothetical protein [Treponema sp.]